MEFLLFFFFEFPQHRKETALGNNKNFKIVLPLFDMENKHSQITDCGVISMLRLAQDLSASLITDFEKHDQRRWKFYDNESKRRRKVLRENLRNLNQDERSRLYVAELSSYEPPMFPVTMSNDDGSAPLSTPLSPAGVGSASASDPVDLRAVPALLQTMAKQEPEAIKRITNQLRDGMSIAQLIAIARVAKESKEEKQALQERRHVLEASLCISDEMVNSSSELVSFMRQLLLDDTEMVLFPDEVRRMLTSVLDTPDDWMEYGGLGGAKTGSAATSAVASPTVATRSFAAPTKAAIAQLDDNEEAADDEEVAMIFDFLKT